MGTQISFVYVDDWQGLYVNERLVAQNHKIGIQQVMGYVLHEVVDRFDYYRASDAHMAMTGAFPASFRDVVLQDGRTIQEMWDSE